MRLPSLEELQAVLPNLRKGLSDRGSGGVPFIPQSTPTDCGAACLAMTLGRWRSSVAVAEIRDGWVNPRDAISAGDVAAAARHYGLQARVVSVEPEQLSGLERGSILYWRKTHFVVLGQVTKERCEILDPSAGVLKLSWAELKDEFSGVAIECWPGPGFSRRRGKTLPLWRYVAYVASESALVPHVVAASLVLMLVGVGLPLMAKAMVDYAVPMRSTQLWKLLIVGIAVLLGIQAAANIARGYLLLWLRARLELRMTVSFVMHLCALPFEFFQRRTTGDLLMRVNANTMVRELLTGALVGSVVDGALSAAYLVTMVLLSGPVAVMCMALAGAQAIVLVVLRGRQRAWLARSLGKQAEAQGFLAEAIGGMESLKAMGLESGVVKKWSSLFADQLGASVAQGKVAVAIDAATASLRSVAAAAVTAFCGYLAIEQAISIGDMVALAAVANGFMAPIVNIVANSSQLLQVSVHLDRLADVVETAEEVGPERRRRIHKVEGDVEVEAISCKYGPTAPEVLKRVSLAVRAGEMVAVVGRTGSGKSTLARAIMGLIVPSEGRVLIDGCDISALDVVLLRQQCGVLTQQPKLVPGSVFENIVLGHHDVGREQATWAAQVAAVHDEIMRLPMGYDTVLTAGGAGLSGGQSQRIALARAILRRPKVLVLDEATSQLDTVTERAVHEALAELKCTRIVIAHRISTVQSADQICVLEDGRMLAAGKHDQLLRTSPLYAQLTSGQRLAGLSGVE